MADETQKFKELLDEKIKELKDQVQSKKNFSSNDLVKMQENLGKKLQELYDEEKIRILNSKDSKSYDDSNLQKLVKQVANKLAINYVLYDDYDTKLTEYDEEDLDKIKQFTPAINNPSFRQQILQAITKADGLPVEIKVLMIKYLSLDPSEGKDNGAEADFFEWAKIEKIKNEKLEKLKEEKKNKSEMLKRYKEFLTGDNSAQLSSSSRGGKKRRKKTKKKKKSKKRKTKRRYKRGKRN